MSTQIFLYLFNSMELAQTVINMSHVRYIKELLNWDVIPQTKLHSLGTTTRLASFLQVWQERTHIRHDAMGQAHLEVLVGLQMTHKAVRSMSFNYHGSN